MSAHFAVAVALGADSSTKQLPREPHLATARAAVVAEMATELARIAPAHEPEARFTRATLRGVAVREVEHARALQPAAAAPCPVHLCVSKGTHTTTVRRANTFFHVYDFAAD